MDDSDDAMDELQLEGDLDPHEAEMLRIELQRLARRHGVELSALEIRPNRPIRRQRSRVRSPSAPVAPRAICMSV